MMKKSVVDKIKVLAKIILYIVLIIVLTLYFSKVFLPDDTSKYYYRENVDAYVVGASGVQTGIIPMEIYDQIGVTVDNISGGEVQLPMDYYLIKENIKINKPKVIFLDGETFFATEMQSRELMHKTVDKYPINFNKIEFVNEEAYKMNLSEKITYLFPFFRFHDRWNEIKAKDFRYHFYGYMSYNHGYSLQTSIIENENLKKHYMDKDDDINEMKKTYESNYSEVYLKKIKKLCDEENIDLVLLVLPLQNWSTIKHNILQEIADENGLKFIDMNLLFEELNFNQETDLMNDNHVNINGALKASKYLANYIEKNYEMVNHRNDLQYSNWDNDLKKYKQKKDGWLIEYNSKLAKVIKEN